MHPRTTGVTALTFLYVSSVLGAGILVVPAVTVQRAGWSALVVWLGLGLACVAVASLFADVSARFPTASGIRDVVGLAFGTRAARGADAVLLVVYLVGNPAMGLASAQYLSSVLGVPLPAAPTALAFMGVALATSCLPTRVVTAVQTWAMRVALGALALALLLALPHLSWQHVVARGPGTPGGVAAAAQVAFYAYLGWENVSLLAAQVTDPGRTFRQAIVRAVPLVAGLYAVAALAYAALPADRPGLLVPALTAGEPTPVRAALLLTSLLAIMAATGSWVLGGTALFSHVGARALPQVRPRLVPVGARVVLAAGYSTVLAAVASGLFALDDLLGWTSCLFLTVYALAAAAVVRLAGRPTLAASTVAAVAITLLATAGVVGVTLLLLATVLVLTTGRNHRARHDHPAAPGVPDRPFVGRR